MAPAADTRLLLKVTGMSCGGCVSMVETATRHGLSAKLLGVANPDAPSADELAALSKRAGGGDAVDAAAVAAALTAECPFVARTGSVCEAHVRLPAGSALARAVAADAAAAQLVAEGAPQLEELVAACHDSLDDLGFAGALLADDAAAEEVRQAPQKQKAAAAKPKMAADPVPPPAAAAAATTAAQDQAAGSSQSWAERIYAQHEEAQGRAAPSAETASAAAAAAATGAAPAAAGGGGDDDDDDAAPPLASLASRVLAGRAAAAATAAPRGTTKTGPEGGASPVLSGFEEAFKAAAEALADTPLVANMYARALDMLHVSAATASSSSTTTSSPFSDSYSALEYVLAFRHHAASYALRGMTAASSRRLEDVLTRDAAEAGVPLPAALYGMADPLTEPRFPGAVADELSKQMRPSAGAAVLDVSAPGAEPSPLAAFAGPIADLTRSLQGFDNAFTRTQRASAILRRGALLQQPLTLADVVVLLGDIDTALAAFEEDDPRHADDTAGGGDAGKAASLPPVSTLQLALVLRAAAWRAVAVDLRDWERALLIKALAFQGDAVASFNAAAHEGVPRQRAVALPSPLCRLGAIPRTTAARLAADAVGLAKAACVSSWDDACPEFLDERFLAGTRRWLEPLRAFVTAERPGAYRPFARAHGVHADSPAAAAGFQVDDELLRFGDVFVSQPQLPPSRAVLAAEEAVSDAAAAAPGSAEAAAAATRAAKAQAEVAATAAMGDDVPAATLGKRFVGTLRATKGSSVAIWVLRTSPPPADAPAGTPKKTQVICLHAVPGPWSGDGLLGIDITV